MKTTLVVFAVAVLLVGRSAAQDPPTCTNGDCYGPPVCTNGDCGPPSCTNGDCGPPSCTNGDCGPPSCTNGDCGDLVDCCCVGPKSSGGPHTAAHVLEWAQSAIQLRRLCDFLPERTSDGLGFVRKALPERLPGGCRSPPIECSNSPPSFVGADFEKELVGAVKAYCDCLSALGGEPPIAILLSLTGGFRLSDVDRAERV